MKKIIIILTLLIVYNPIAFAQFNCNSYFSESDSFQNEMFHGYLDKHAVPIDGEEILIKEIYIAVQDLGFSGKIGLQLVIDSTGVIQCSRVLTCGEKMVNNDLVNKLHRFKFHPAELNSNKVVSILFVPVVLDKTN